MPASTPPVQHRTRFFDHRIPALSAGRYTITLEQSISGLPTGDTLPTRQQGFDVRETRFAIAGTDVHACYPVAGSTGLYSQVLPHLTIDTPALPWFRKLKGQAPSVPWVALLVFRGGELPEDPQALGVVRACTVSDLIAGELPGRPPAIAPEHLFDDERDLSIATVLVPRDLFKAIAPLPEEMGLLAHVGEGGPPDATLGARSEPDEEDLNAVVVANRFPDVAGGYHVAHLVSLDGFEDCLGAGGTVPPEGLRLVSLFSWVFESEPDSGTGFGDLAHNMAVAKDTLLRLPVTPPSNPNAAQREMADRLSRGSAALPQRLDSGERTLAFYRGPLTAAPAQRLPAPGTGQRLESAGEALIYLKDHGVFDTGYAAAFSLGRTLALADAEFRSALLAFRKAARGAARRLLTHPRFASQEVTAATAELLSGQRSITREAFDRLLTEAAGTRFTTALATAGANIEAGHVRVATRSAPPQPLTAASLRSALSNPGVTNVLRQATATEIHPVRAWLDRLPLLEMIPFEHLVPNLRMLPAESIRFFYLDPGWVRAAVDGALSIGVGHTLDADLNALARETQTPPACGVLVRSDIVAGWPDTIYSAFRGDSPVEPARVAHYGTDVLMLLYPSVIDTFAMAEPPQGLHFGFSDIGTIELRKLTEPGIGTPMGEFPENPGDDRFGRFLRPGSHDVLNITGTGDALLPALARAHGRSTLSSAELTLQMVKAPQLQTFARP